MPDFQPTRWADLVVGATIVCPGDGNTEKVTLNRVGGKGRRHVRTDRHDHIRPADGTVQAHNDNGHRDTTYRTRWGTAITTRPGFRAPTWLYLPPDWPERPRPSTRQNGKGGYFFTSGAQARRFLAPYLVREPAGEAHDQLPRRPEGSPPIRRGGYT